LTGANAQLAASVANCCGELLPGCRNQPAFAIWGFDKGGAVAFELHPGRGAAADARSPLVDVSAGGGAGAHLVHSAYHIGAMWIAFQIGHNTALALAAAAILKRLGPSLFSFDHLDDVLVFLGTAILVPGMAALGFVTAVNTFCSEETIRLHGWSVSFWDSLSRTWLTNTVTFLLFVPVILLIASRGRFWIRT